MRSMAIVTTTRHGAVRLTLPYSVLSAGMPCGRVLVQSTSPAYSECPRHRVNPCQEGHAPSDKPPVVEGTLSQQPVRPSGHSRPPGDGGDSCRRPLGYEEPDAGQA